MGLYQPRQTIAAKAEVEPFGIFSALYTWNIGTRAPVGGLIPLKLSKLGLAMKRAENKFAAIEDLADEELENLHRECRVRADMTKSILKDAKSDREAHAAIRRVPRKR